MKNVITSSDGRFRVLVTKTKSVCGADNAIAIRCNVDTDDEVTHTFFFGHDDEGDFVYLKLNSKDDGTNEQHFIIHNDKVACEIPFLKKVYFEDKEE